MVALELVLAPHPLQLEPEPATEAAMSETLRVATLGRLVACQIPRTQDHTT